MTKLQEFARLQEKKRAGNKLVIPTVEQHLMTVPPGERDPYHAHPSEMAKKDWCERATWHRIQTGEWKKDKDDKFSFTLQSIFDEGHQIHDKWQSWLKDTGKLFGDWHCAVCHESAFDCLAENLKRYGGNQFAREHPHYWIYDEVVLEHGIIRGHEDGAIDDRLVEFKSIGLGTLRHESPDLLSKFYVRTEHGGKIYDVDAIWQALTHPLQSHVRQANIYMFLAQMMGGEYARFKTCSIVYEYKFNQQSREFVIPYSEDIVGPLVRRTYALGDKSMPPPCPFGGCKQCQAYEDDAPPVRRLRRVPPPGTLRSCRDPGEAAGTVLGGG